MPEELGWPELEVAGYVESTIRKQNVVNECLFQFISSFIKSSVPSQGAVPSAVGGSFTSINQIKITPNILRSLFPVAPDFKLITETSSQDCPEVS